MDVVDETPAAVDLDHGDPLPVRGLELGLTVDGDLAQLEAQLGLRRRHHAARRLAEVAADRREQDDLGYG